jgi:hypothetical protein
MLYEATAENDILRVGPLCDERVGFGLVVACSKAGIAYAGKESEW